MAKEPDPETAVVGTGDLAKILGVSTERVRQLVDTGVLPKVARGQFRVKECVQAYLKMRLAKPVESTEKQRLDGKRADEIERRLAREDASLISMGEALIAYDDLTGDLVESMQGMPTLIAKPGFERERITKIVVQDVAALKRKFAATRQRLVTGEQNPELVEQDT